MGLHTLPGGAIPGCTKSGTPSADHINGTDRPDVICARGGPDYANGRGGPDTVKGAKGSDTIVGGEQTDHLEGGGKRDDLFATDGNAGDVIVGGPGKDRCYGDTGDVFATSCEKKVRV